MTIAEKVAYIKGLAEGMKINQSTDEGKLTLAMLDVLGDISEIIEEFDETFDDMAEVMSDIEESVYELEDEVFGDDDDYLDYDDFEDDLYEVTCDECGKTTTIEYDTLKSNEITCPACGKELVFDLDFIDDEDCDCDCGCGNDR